MRLTILDSRDMPDDPRVRAVQGVAEGHELRAPGDQEHGLQVENDEDAGDAAIAGHVAQGDDVYQAASTRQRLQGSNRPERRHVPTISLIFSTMAAAEIPS